MSHKKSAVKPCVYKAPRRFFHALWTVGNGGEAADAGKLLTEFTAWAVSQLGEMVDRKFKRLLHLK
jgi:hypothetical protein